jgi:Tol biopolymer transport system component
MVLMLYAHRRLLTVLVCLLPATAASAQQAQWAVYVMKIDGSETRRVAQVEGCRSHSNPRWSHDGKRIAFDASNANTFLRSVYIVNFDGTDLRKLDDSEHPDWSPDDKQIASDRRGVNQSHSVFVQNLDGQGLTEIAPGSDPRWSPDGSELAIAEPNNVLIVNLISNESRQLFETAQTEVLSGFAWAPDGRHLAVVVRPDPAGMRHLMLVDARGAGQGSVIRKKGQMGGPICFSADGKQLVYTDGWKVRTIQVEGQGESKIIPGQIGRSKNPSWSPDGQWIVFCSDRDPN